MLIETLHTQAAARATWKSPEYAHYTVSLQRHSKSDGSPDYLEFVFTCRHDPTTHKPSTRRRMKTSDGTNNLKRGNLACLRKRKVVADGDSNAGAQQTLYKTVSKYTKAAHRALIAMRCAVSKRPFHSVADPLYLAEVELLRPGTDVPHETTVSRDVRHIYEDGAVLVRDYFKV